jgi:hypothetical protein
MDSLSFHILQARLPYIQHVHNEDLKWHYSMDSIVFNTSHYLVELFTAMTDLNKSISNSSNMFWIFIICYFQSFIVQFHYLFIYLFPSPWNLTMCSQGSCMNFSNIQFIGNIPLKQFQTIIPMDVFKKCQNKSHKTWHSLTLEAFFYYMYKVNNLLFPII